MGGRRRWWALSAGVALGATAAFLVVVGPARGTGGDGAVDAVSVQSPEEVLAADAEQLAADLGVGREEAEAIIARRPLVDALRRYLRDRLGPAFSDLYLAYGPYRVVVLVLDGSDLTDELAADPRFAELAPFVEFRRVDHTEDLLVRAMAQVGALAGPTGTQAADADIRTGVVTVWVASEEQAADLRAAVEDAAASGELLVPASSVRVLVGGGLLELG